ncbi:MAG: hypothetical protein AAF928_07910 [Myxococcota bacterium]
MTVGACLAVTQGVDTAAWAQTPAADATSPAGEDDDPPRTSAAAPPPPTRDDDDASGGPSPPRLDARSLLELATTRFERGNYSKAAEILAGLLRVEVDPTTDAGRARRQVYLQARPLYAACLIALGQPEQADAVILDQYRDDPFYELPRGMFPQPVVDRFIEVEATHRDELERRKARVVAGQQSLARRRAALAKARAARLEELERMAAERLVVTTRSRWIATVPFGIGQFQNDDLGWGAFFAISESLTFGAALVSFIYVERLPAPESINCGNDTAEDADGNLREVSCSALRNRFDIGRGVNWASSVAGLALLVTGVVEAQVSFESERVIKTKRPIPPPITPDAIITPDGAFFGLSGRF